MTIYQYLIQMQMEENSSRLLGFFLLGAGGWIAYFLLVSRPLRSYFLAHELSHLLAAWLCGVRAGRLSVHSTGGSVEVARSSIWIALAPYYIPFYALLLLLLHFLAQLFWDPALWIRWLPLALGITWCFHVSFTLYALSVRQSDIDPYGRIGAYSLILMGNLIWLCLGLMLVNPSPLSTDLHLLLNEQQKAYQYSLHILRQLIDHIKNAIFQA